MSIADRLSSFGVTIFSEMTALPLDDIAINLGQGFPPNWEEPGSCEAAACSLAEGGSDQYPPSQECRRCDKPLPIGTGRCWGGTSILAEK